MSKILEHRGNPTSEFKIRWKGWAPKYDTWEPTNNILDQKMLSDYITENGKLQLEW